MSKNTVFIALLRGVNVGGHNKVEMADLRQLLTNSGFKNVKTYIQSGNVIFQSKEIDTKILEGTIHTAIKDFFDFEVPIIVKTRNELHTIFKNCPFSENIKMDSYFVMLSEVPKDALVKKASEKTYPDEDFHIINDCIYFFPKKGYGKAKFNLNFFERKLEVNATGRNYKTMVKLLSLSQTIE